MTTMDKIRKILKSVRGSLKVLHVTEKMRSNKKVKTCYGYVMRRDKRLKKGYKSMMRMHVKERRRREDQRRD